jgi:xylan 1,4-beta-xylosidase
MRQKYRQILQFFSLALAVAGVSIGLSRIDQIQTLYIQAAKKPAHLIIDAEGIVGPLRPTWQNLAQGGEGDWFSVQDLSAQLTPLKPQYIRLDHLYDFYIQVSRENGRLHYDFTKLDRLLAEFKAVGATPFISLSYTPDILNSDIIGTPDNWTEYQAIIKRTIEHISGTRELNFTGVYYEVWNEPDLFGQWKTYGEKNYLQLYRSAALAAASAQSVQPFKFGGPATTKLYDNWIDALIKMVLTENLRLDFYSWHHYNWDPEAYVQDVTRLERKLRQYPQLALKVEYIISEWGPDSDNHPAYDNSVGAAHLAASVISFPANLSKAFIFEIQDGKSPAGDEYWGRWGLFTHPDFGSNIKPRAEAVGLLNQLGPDRLSLIGQGSEVTAMAVKKDSTIQILVTNYDPQHQRAENVPVTLKRLTPGTYTISRQYLSRSRTATTVTIDAPTYTFSIPMPANTVALLELTPSP